MVQKVQRRYWSKLVFAAAVGTAGWLALLGETAWCQVLSFGDNQVNGQGLGTGFVTVADGIDTSNLGGKTISQVSSGAIHSLLLADDGSVFSFGSNLLGSSGQGTATGLTLVADPIDTTNIAGKTFTQVSAGTDHSLILADDGSVFAFGNNANGRTGVGTVTGRTEIATPIRSNTLGGRAITQVSAGREFSLLLADDGTVFSFGFSSFGRTGLGIDSNTNTLLPTLIDTSNLGGRTVTQVSAGFRHSLILTDDGTVFAFGTNQSGATGLNTTVGNTTVATEIDISNLGGRTIAQVEAGSSHSLILADDGTVFSFGFNSYTGLGFGFGNTLVATPIATNNLGGRSIAKISVNEVTNLLLADDGTVFGFGTNSVGRLGLGPGIGDTYFALPLVTTNLGSLPVTEIAAGGQQGLLLAPGYVSPPSPDMDNDGDVDGNDFLLIQRSNPALIPLWESQYGSVTSLTASQAVPEPSAVVLIAGLSAMGLLVRPCRQLDVSCRAEESMPKKMALR